MNQLKLIPILLIVLLLISCQPSDEQSDKPSGNQGTEQDLDRDGIFIHLTRGAEDPHRVGMALNMAVLMSEDKNVLLYCDINAVDIVLKDSPNIEYRQFPGSRLQIEKLLGKGVTIMACPGCLKAAGRNTDELIEGVMVAEKEKFFNFTNGKIISIDY